MRSYLSAKLFCPFLFFLDFCIFGSLPVLLRTRDTRKTANANNFFKTGRDCEHLLHFYQVKIVNIDMRRMDVLNTNLDGYERN